MTKHFIKRQLFAGALDRWQKEGIKEGSSTEAYQWVPNVKNIPSYFPTNHFVSQAVTGHGRFPHYLYRFGLKEDKICSCQKEANNFDHYLDECTMRKSLSGKFKKKLRHQLSKQKQEIIKDEKLAECLAQMVEEINNIT